MSWPILGCKRSISRSQSPAPSPFPDSKAPAACTEAASSRRWDAPGNAGPDRPPSPTAVRHLPLHMFATERLRIFGVHFQGSTLKGLFCTTTKVEVGYVALGIPVKRAAESINLLWKETWIKLIN